MAISRKGLQHRLEAFVETCRRQGLKATHQRMEIFRELAGSEDHPEAETVYQSVRQRIPAISRDTVYRTLSTLEEHGLICRAEALSGPARFDANPERHHHFICTACGSIRDFHSDALDELPVAEAVKNLGRAESAQVQVRGVCRTCREQRRR